jgi:hypothetical protein
MRRRLLKIGAGLVASLAIFAFAVTAVFAASAHFISSSASVDSSGSLVVSWKETGLGDNQFITYTASANASATWVCVNNGDKNPSAANKTAVSAPVSGSGSFSSSKNGGIAASLTATPAIAAPVSMCGGGGTKNGGGQVPELAMVTYTDITLSDDTNHITVNFGTVSSACLLPKVRGAC